MADRPIIFSAPMVRALLDGRKTQTRRVIKHKSIEVGIAPRVEVDHPTWIQFLHPQGGPLTCVKWPYAPGDRLYVREAHAYDGPIVRYYATDDVHELRRKRPSIHMPRWASRLTLTVTEVRVQRLQDITGRDMIAEGVRCQGCHDVGTGDYSACRDGGCFEQRGDFIHLWNSLHGPEAWDANPWVVALTFTVQHGNIDQLSQSPARGGTGPGPS